MKAFTDLEQSKKLAEILPIESADMFHFIHEVDTVGFGYKKEAAEFYSKTEFEYLPCWSLAALLDIIPQEIFDGEYVINITEGCDNRWVLTYDYYENRNHSYYGLSTGADNLIDACYEMIIKLHEQKIL